MAFNRKQRLRDNIEAIRTAFILDRERRTATAEEQAITSEVLRFRRVEVHTEPGKGTDGCRALGEIGPRTVCPYGGTAQLVRENSKDDTEYKRYADA